MPPPRTPLTPDQPYEAIEAAVMETARGRAFLAEFSRRNRVADTRMLLHALARLEAAVGGGVGAASAASLARADLAAGGAPYPGDSGPTSALLAQIAGAERAVLTIGDAAEGIGEIAWTLRERGFDPGLCDALDARASEILAACRAHERVTERVGAAVRALPGPDGPASATSQRNVVGSGSRRMDASGSSDPPRQDGAPIAVVGDRAGPGRPSALADPEGKSAGSAGEAAGAPHPTRPALAALLAQLEALDARARLRLFS